MVSASAPFDVTVGKRFASEPPLDLILSAADMKIFSVGEFGGRIANGLCAILAILAVYWAGLGMFRRRAAVLSALALATLPLFVLEARQIVSDMPLIATLALALGGLGLRDLPQPQSHRRTGANPRGEEHEPQGV
jgi:4-amino-4-deoxy-L-arabinose transferase-like glycosyltransferase